MFGEHDFYMTMFGKVALVVVSIGCIYQAIKGRKTVPRRKQISLTILFFSWLAYGVWYFLL